MELADGETGDGWTPAAGLSRHDNRWDGPAARWRFHRGGFSGASEKANSAAAVRGGIAAEAEIIKPFQCIRRSGARKKPGGNKTTGRKKRQLPG